MFKNFIKPLVRNARGWFGSFAKKTMIELSTVFS